MNKRFSLFIGVLLLLVIVEGGILMKDHFPFVQARIGNPQRSLKEYADDIIQKCAQEKWKPGCYDKEIPKLMDAISMKDAFEVTKEVQRQDQNYWYCHVLGHNVSAKETAKDPSKWKEVVAQCPSGMCSNGCIHGAFQERFRSEALDDVQIEELIPDLKTICEGRPNWQPTGMEKASCYHALGHLIMYITNADIVKSNRLCEIAAPGYTRVCFDGNFMQIFQPLEPEDIALVESYDVDTAEKAASFCNQFSGQRLGACWRESWPLSAQKIRTPSGAVDFCEHLQESAEKRICYNSLFYILTAQFKFDSDTIKNFCQNLPSGLQGTCFAQSASRLIETDYTLADKAVYLCETAAQGEAQKACYDQLVVDARFNFHANSSEAQSLCERLPEPWKSQCPR